MKSESEDVAREEEDHVVSPSDRNSRVMMSSLLVWLSELCERVTYYGIVANMADYVTSPCFPERYHLPWVVTWVFTGCAYTLTFFGGWLADTVGNRFWTILVSMWIYLVGTALLVASSSLCGSHPDGRVSGLYFAGLTLVAIGTGGSKSNLGLFGAQQYKGLGEDAKVQLQHFFHWYYWCINLGATIGVVGVPTLQKHVSVLSGYVVTCVCVVLSALVFVLGRIGSFYSQENSTHEIRSRIVAGLLDPSRKTRRRELQGRLWSSTIPKEVWKLMQIFATLIPYYAIYSQTRTTYLFQSERLRMPAGSEATYFSAINNLTILLMIPLMVRFVYPRLTNKEVQFTPLTVMGVGILLSTLSVLSAEVVEVGRRQLVHSGHFFQQAVGNRTLRAAELSVAVQIPQLVLSGVSEVFTLAVGYYFAYTEAPPGYEGTIMGAFLLMWGLGSGLSVLLTEIVNAICYGVSGAACFPLELNDGHVEYFFLTLAVLLMATFGVFWYLERHYVYSPSSSTKYHAQPSTLSRVMPYTRALLTVSNQGAFPWSNGQ
ncbi:solute carrier family 15 member 4-like [Branchiostoma floridae]|uniref:Solute carrier family 15 member 4-like n=1 Tax=Branchiostoma floridae TaxID=7739 RepID=A0A9J7KTG0_BRAFL|nr:solute carrier family 15 member 4-like [Branchiostoma floridae]